MTVIWSHLKRLADYQSNSKHGSRLKDLGKKKKKLLNMLLPWQANGIIERAALIQWLLCFFNPHVWVLLPLPINVSCISRLLYLCRCVLLILLLFSSLCSSTVFMYYSPSLLNEPMCGSPSEPNLLLLLYQHRLPPQFCNPHDRIVLKEGFAPEVINYWPVMKIGHCHNPSNSVPCERRAQRLCFLPSRKATQAIGERGEARGRTHLAT